MSADHLFLVNHHDWAAIELQFPWVRGPRQPTTPCRIPHNGLIDLSVVFPDLSKDQIRAIVVASPDYLRFRKRFQVELVDESAPPVDRSHLAVPMPGAKGVKARNGFRLLPPSPPPEETPAPPVGDPLPPVYHPNTPPLPREPGTTREDAAIRIAEEKLALKAYQETQARMKAGTEGERQPGQPEGEAAEPIADGALDPSAKAQLVDNIPSTRWTVERLAEYAKKKNIDVTNLSKNAILRKIRGS